jgi:tetratricopeptide (TPR) repeat protein
MAGASFIRFSPRASLVLFAVLLLTFSAGACRKRANSGNANSNSSANPGNPDETKRQAQSLVDQARELYKNDEDERALEVLKQAIQIDPNHAEAHLRLGMSLAALGKKDEGEEQYKKASELFQKRIQNDSKDSADYFYLAEAYNFLHRDEDAARTYRQATQIKSDDEETWYRLGISLNKLARYTEAIGAFEKALELQPEDYRASDGLEEAKEGAQRIRQGKKHNEEMLRKQQENANANSNSSSKPSP